MWTSGEGCGCCAIKWLTAATIPRKKASDDHPSVRRVLDLFIIIFLPSLLRVRLPFMPTHSHERFSPPETKPPPASPPPPPATSPAPPPTPPSTPPASRLAALSFRGVLIRGWLPREKEAKKRLTPLSPAALSGNVSATTTTSSSSTAAMEKVKLARPLHFDVSAHRATRIMSLEMRHKEKALKKETFPQKKTHPGGFYPRSCSRQVKLTSVRPFQSAGIPEGEIRRQASVTTKPENQRISRWPTEERQSTLTTATPQP